MRMLRIVASIIVITASAGNANAGGGTAFTYQGRLLDAGEPADGLFDFEFRLWDAAADGNQIGSTQTSLAHPVDEGLFTAVVDFGPDAFNGRARWLEIAINGTPLDSRQPLTPAPMSLALPGLWTRQGDSSVSIIGGYHGNVITCCQDGSTISGGGDAESPNTITAYFCTIGGGKGNFITGFAATIAGGESNTASRALGAIGGGRSNWAGGGHATIGGGEDNVAGAVHTTVGGGRGNEASGSWSTIGGGAFNDSTGLASTVAGGNGNVASQNYATVGGGSANNASGFYSTVPGGRSNTAAGNYSLAVGRRAKAEHHGMFVWADETDRDFPSMTESLFVPAEDQFLARVTGGVVFVSAVDGIGNSTAGVELPAGAGAWDMLSDRLAKVNIAPVDGREVLAHLTALPITTWNYISQDPSIRHIGPTAQDFRAAFVLGRDERHISTIDTDGVALAAIQGLREIVQEKDRQITELTARMESLENLVQKIARQVEGGAK